MDGVSSGRPQSFRYQRQPVDDCSAGSGVMAQDGRTIGGTLHGEMDRCRESRGWTTACSSMPERDDGKNLGEDCPKQECSCWFSRYKWLAKSGANLYPRGVLFTDAILPFSGVTLFFVLFCFVFVFLFLLNPRPFVQSFFDMHAPRQPHTRS